MNICCQTLKSGRLAKNLLIQTISRVNRKYPGKEFGMVIDYIGIRDNMREAMKIYGGDTSVAPGGSIFPV